MGELLWGLRMFLQIQPLKITPCGASYARTQVAKRTQVTPSRPQAVFTAAAAQHAAYPTHQAHSTQVGLHRKTM